jgi:hypothetical protein
MKYPTTLSGTTPYYEKYFAFCEETPHAYVSAFREAQFEALGKRRTAYAMFSLLVTFTMIAWLLGYLPFLLALLLWAGSWALVSWHNRQEARLLSKTFELALRGKDKAFQDYMWRHLDRRMLLLDS